MTGPGEIKNLTLGDELHTCPECGYEKGFHTSFLALRANKDSPVKSTREVELRDSHMPGMWCTV